MVEGGVWRSSIGPESELTLVTGGAIERGSPYISFPWWNLTAQVAEVIVGDSDFEDPAPVGRRVFVEGTVKGRGDGYALALPGELNVGGPLFTMGGEYAGGWGGGPSEIVNSGGLPPEV